MPPIYIGSQLVTGLRVGAQIVSAVYIGPTLAYSANPANPDFSPAALFAEGEQGVWYDPSDMSTLYQDSAGTTPVTAVGQPVGKMLDKSGRGNHMTQLTSTSRPIYQIDANGRPYLNFDGVDDWMQVASCDLSMNNKLLVSVAVNKSQNSVAAIFVELSVDINANPGTFYITAPEFTGPNSDFRFRSRGSSVSSGAPTTGSAPAGTPFVVTGTADIAVPVKSIRLNGILKESSPQDQGVGNFGNYPMYLGRRGGSSGLFFAGDLYGLIIRGAATPDPTISLVEGYLNSKSGAY